MNYKILKSKGFIHQNVVIDVTHFSSPEPNAPRSAYSICRYPSSVNIVNKTSSLKQNYFHISNIASIGQGNK